MAKHDLCVLCGESIPKYRQISHRNEQLKDHFVFCTECVTKALATDEERPIDVLRMLNIPFVISIWEDAEGRAETSKSPAISEYLKLIATQRRKYKTFQDSEFEYSVKDTFEVTDELIGRWGTLENEDQYIDRELSYKDLIKLKPPSSSMEDRQYVEAVRIGARLREEIVDGKASDIKALRTAYAESLQDIGLDNATINNRDSEEGIGLHIQKFENTEPIPEIAPEFKDVDRIMDYIRVLFTTSMKRAFGKATEDEIEELQNLRESIIPGGDLDD